MRPKSEESSFVQWAIVLTVMMMTFTMAAAGVEKQNSTSARIKPDLYIVKCQPTLVAALSDGRHWIRIEVTIANSVPGASLPDTVYLRAAYTDGSSAVEHAVGQSPVSCPHYSLASAKMPVVVTQVDHYVPAGKRYNYRIYIDWGNVVSERNEENNVCNTYYSNSTIGDGGSDGAVIRGVDLVVSSVEVRRGVFAGVRKIQIIPVVRNMWHGRTATRIKISLTELSLAEWIEGGIGPDEEKRGGALYVDDPAGNLSLSFHAEVDEYNAITENNEANNVCGPVVLGPSIPQVIHACAIVGPHEDLR
jgi:hypothetical protein